MSDIDLTEAMEAAADVVRSNVYVRRHETVIDAAVVPQILTAALPYIREQLAQEIEAYAAAFDSEPDAYHAARIARGERS